MSLRSQVTETFLEYPDNKSIATIFYFCGCDRFCKGCHNTNLQNFVEFDAQEVISAIKNYCSRINTNKVVLCGGDPLYQKNLPITKEVLSILSNQGYDICIYTGADIEEVKNLNLTGFKYIKCGIFDANQYIGSKKNDDYLQLATRNQKLYDSKLNLLSKDGVYYYDSRRNEKTN